jgi:hypothetical protein
MAVLSVTRERSAGVQAAGGSKQQEAVPAWRVPGATLLESGDVAGRVVVRRLLPEHSSACMPQLQSARRLWPQAESREHAHEAARTMMSTLHVRLSRTVQLPKKSSHLPAARCSGTGQQHACAAALRAVSRGRAGRAPRERHVAGAVVASAPRRRWRYQGQVVVCGGLRTDGARLGLCAQQDGQAASVRGGPHRFHERPLRCRLCG